MSPHPRCACGQPVAFTIRRQHAWGTGPYEHVCATCAPDPTECAWWAVFGSFAAEAEALRGAA